MPGGGAGQGHRQEDETQAEDALADAADRFRPAELEAEQSEDEKQRVVVEDPEGDELHRDGDADVRPEQEDDEAVGGDPAGVEQLQGKQRLGGRGGRHGAERKSRQQRGGAALLHGLHPLVHPFAGEAIETFAQETNECQKE